MDNQHTMTEPKTNISHTTGYLAVYIIKAAIPIITLPVFTRIITPEEYGVLALAMIFGSIISGLSNLGLSVVYNREFFQLEQKNTGVDTLLLSNVIFSSLVFIILIAVTIIFSNQVSILVTKSPSQSLLIIGASVLCFLNLLFTEYCLNYWRNRQNVKKYIIFTLLYIIINNTLTILFIVVFRWSIYGIVLSNIVSLGLLFTVFIISFISWKNPFNINIIRNALKISYPLTPHVFVGVLNTQFDKYIVSIFGELKNVGVYDIGKRISNQIFTLLTAVQNVYLPVVYKKLFSKDKNDKKSIGPYLTPFLYISFLISFLCALFSEELVLLLLPVSYHGAIPVLIPLSIAFAPMFFGKISGQQLIFAKKLNISMILVFINSVFFTLINFISIYNYGVLGAGFSNLIFSVLSNSIGIFIAQKYCRINWEYKKIIPLTIILFVGSCIVFLVLFLNIYYFIRLIIKIIIVSLFILIGFTNKSINKVFIKQLFKIKQ